LIVLAPFWRYNWVVTTIQIKNVSEEAHAVLRLRAAAAGQSLQEYMLNWIDRSTRRPTVDEVLARVEHHSGGHLPWESVVQQLRDERERR
jgi:antitoxin FitA